MSTIRPRARPAYTRGTTRCAYNPPGTRLITAGANPTLRLYKTGFDGEPINIDDVPENSYAVATGTDYFYIGGDDGTVSVYTVDDPPTFKEIMTRVTMPVRDLFLSGDEKWVAVASDELTVKIVSTADHAKVRVLREHNRPAKHVSIDPRGSLAAVSCQDGIIYMYSLLGPEPELLKKLDGMIGSIDAESPGSAEVVWHPDGRAFAVASPTRDVFLISRDDYQKHATFENGHSGMITALAWSPNGAVLATAAHDGKILLWSAGAQTIVQTLEFSNVMDLAWHPTQNLLSFTTSEGEVYIHPDPLRDENAALLRLPLQQSVSNHALAGAQTGNGLRTALASRPRNPEDEGENLGSDSELDDFVVDDDGAGYTTGHKRRASDDPSGPLAPLAKRHHQMATTFHEAFQPGATPWRGNRKYLGLNLIGAVWTVDQDSHNTVTVEFYDREFQRDFHFTDTFLYDKACLTESGTLFSSPSRPGVPANLFYRPHETWTQRTDWRTDLPSGEDVLAMSLSDSFTTVITTGGYVRIFTLLGLPYRVYRPKSMPVVTCASWKNYVMTVGNGPVGADGQACLLYTIENIKKDEVIQNEDIVALPPGASLRSVFFSDEGDPCIYDSTGVLLTLVHWRRPSGAYWAPLLDTKLLARLASGKKNENYFPIAVANNKFHCIILKGGDRYPYFPRPLLSDFEFLVPLHSVADAKEKAKKKAADADGDADMADNNEEEDTSESRKLEQAFLLHSLLAAQLTGALEDGAGSSEERLTNKSRLARMCTEVDKTLLQLLAIECREGEERGMKALEIVRLFRDRTGRMVQAAGKIAERYERTVLGEKIREYAERLDAGEYED